VIERHGVRGSEYEGVFFTEATSIDGANDLGTVNIKLRGQNKDLRHVKTELARKVRAKGGNGLIQFEYGQRNTFFGYDQWVGSGRAVLLRG
jgi:hypothetical protein